MSLFRRFNKFITKKGKRVNNQQLAFAQNQANRLNVRSALGLAEIEEETGFDQNYSAQHLLESISKSGDKMVILQSESKGFAKLGEEGSSDYGKIDSENFVHSLKRDNPQDFRLDELEEVESVVLESAPRRNKNPTIDQELVDFFGFITKKLESNTQGLQTAKQSTAMILPAESKLSLWSQALEQPAARQGLLLKCQLYLTQTAKDLPIFNL